MLLPLSESSPYTFYIASDPSIFMPYFENNLLQEPYKVMLTKTLFLQNPLFIVSLPS